MTDLPEQHDDEATTTDAAAPGPEQHDDEAPADAAPTSAQHDAGEQHDAPGRSTPPTGATPPTETPAGGPPPTGTPAGGPPPAGTTPPAGSPPSAPPVQQWPQRSDADRRNWAVGAHLSALVAFFVGFAVLGPLLVYLIKRDEDEFVAEHAREALNFQLTWLVGGIVAGIVAVIVSIVTLGLGLIVFVPAAIGFGIAWVVFMVKASMAASRGEYYRYPLTVRVVS